MAAKKSFKLPTKAGRPRLNPRRNDPAGYCSIPPDKRIQKGEVRNPYGKRGKNFIPINVLFNRIAKQEVPEQVLQDLRKALPEFEIADGMTVQEAIAARIAYDAMKGVPYALQNWNDRMYGKVTDKIEIENSNPSPTIIADVRTALTDKEVVNLRGVLRKTLRKQVRVQHPATIGKGGADE